MANLKRQLFLLLGICLLVPALSAAKPTRVAVLDLKLERGLDAPTVRLLNELLLAELAKAANLEVIGGSDIRAMIEAEESRQHFGCDDDSCLAEIGAALGAEFLVVGTLGAVGSRYLLSLKWLNARQASVVARSTHTVPSNEDAIVDAIRVAAQELIAGWRGEPKAQAVEPTLSKTAAEPSGVSRSQEVASAPVKAARTAIWPAWTATGVALVAGGLGAYADYHALAQAKFRDSATERAEYADYHQRSITASRWSTSLFVGGGVAAAGALGLWLWHALSASASKSEQAIQITPTGVAVGF